MSDARYQDGMRPDVNGVYPRGSLEFTEAEQERLREMQAEFFGSKGMPTDPTDRAMLDDMFDRGLDQNEVAEKHGISPSTVSRVRNPPRGRRYFEHKILNLRSNLNAAVGREIMRRLDTNAATIPIEVLVKIYSVTLPKESVVTALELLHDEVRKIAAENRMTPEQTEKMHEFVDMQAAA